MLTVPLPWHTQHAYRKGAAECTLYGVLLVFISQACHGRAEELTLQRATEALQGAAERERQAAELSSQPWPLPLPQPRPQPPGSTPKGIAAPPPPLKAAPKAR